LENFLTLDEQHRTCSYCRSLGTFATHELFSAHWQRCPARVAAGYIERPLDEIPAELARLRRKAKRLIQKAAELMQSADDLETRLHKAARQTT